MSTSAAISIGRRSLLFTLLWQLVVYTILMLITKGKGIIYIPILMLMFYIISAQGVNMVYVYKTEIVFKNPFSPFVKNISIPLNEIHKLEIDVKRYGANYMSGNTILTFELNNGRKKKLCMYFANKDRRTIAEELRRHQIEVKVYDPF